MSNYILPYAIRESFRSAMNNKGITVPSEIYADNTTHRFNVHGDKSKTKNGWYLIFPNHITNNTFGYRKRDVSYPWCQHKERIEEVKRKSKLEINHAAEQAQYIYNYSCPAAPFHPYLKQKLIQPLFARQKLNNLILPIIDFDLLIWGLQFISPKGTKYFLSNGANYYPDACIPSACNAGNLAPVALTMRKRFPTAKIIIYADDDKLNINNPDLTKGRAAAVASGSFFCTPNWPNDAPKDLTDFNDLSCWLAQEELMA